MLPGTEIESYTGNGQQVAHLQDTYDDDEILT